MSTPAATMRSYKEHFGRFLASDLDRIHAAAHSHHPWPDVTFAAHQQAWLDAAALHDDKWEHVFATVLPEAQARIAARLDLPDPSTIAVASNTHELLTRILSCLPHSAPGRETVRVLTTAAEFHSAERQLRRLEESGLADVERVDAEPFDTLDARLVERAAAGGWDLVLVSHVLYDSGHVVDVEAVVDAVDDEGTVVVIDGYHGFAAVPTSLAAVADRAFYLAGGYKYAMAGEGVCFAHCPPGICPRPIDTGWFAGFDTLADGERGTVAYPRHGGRFLGATFDPSGLYRFNAAQRLLDELGVDVVDVHARVGALQQQLLDAIAEVPVAGLRLDALLPLVDASDRGHFLTFRHHDAGALVAALADRKVVVDHRGDRVRFGFGLYHDPTDVEELHSRLAGIAG